jgi:ATP/maltotriose-dependent transcriptional regulator MalT
MARSEVVVGREPELRAVGRFLDGVPEGACGLVLEGAPGIGKTTVWRDVFAQADARGLPVLACRPVEAETKLAFASLADLLAPVADEGLPALPEPQRLALEVALLRASPRDVPPDGRAVGTAVASLLAHLTDASPLVLAVDDVQWLDRPSASALAFALRRLTDRRVGVVVASRVENGSPADPLALGQALPERLERLRLRPLALSGLHQVIRTRLGHVFPRPTLRRIAEASGGNPLFALELARALTDAGARPQPGDPLPVPATLTALLSERVAGLPARSREALLAVAVLASPTTGLIARALGHETASALGRAKKAGVIETEDERVRFSHPLLASAVYSSAAPEQRRAMHSRLAVVALDPEERARHLALANAEPNADVARALDAAAERARARGAPDAAAELQEQAARLTPPADTGAIRRRTTRAASHFFHAGDRPHARSLLEAVLADAPAGPERAEALHVLAEVRYHDDSFPDAIELFEEALQYVDDAPELIAPIELGLVMAFIGAAQFGAADPHARRAVELAEALGDRALLAQALALVAFVDFFLGRGTDEEKIARALELEDTSQPAPIQLRPSMLAATLLFYSGHLARARSLYYALWDRLVERGEESHMPVLAAHIAWLECSLGDLRAAAAIADEGMATSLLVGSENMQAFLLCFRGLVHAYEGDADAARSELGQSIDTFMRNGFVVGLLLGLSFLGFLEVSLGRPAEAHAVLEGVVGPLEWDVGEPFVLRYLPEEIEALVGLGELGRAEELVATFEQGARDRDRAWALAAAGRCRGLIAAARGDLPEASNALERALEEHERAEFPFELARTLVVLGQVRRRRGERRAAKDALERAHALFEGRGASLWAQRAAAELRRVPIRRGAPEELTPSEERIAELAAAGRTNREVAQALFISPKTVEANLSRVYRKLELGSRAELGARMAERRRQNNPPKP